MSPQQDLLTIALRQHGVVSRADLRIAGVTRSMRRRMLARGDLIAEGIDAHRLASFPITALQGVLLACVENQAVASHQTAAALHGVGPLRLRPVHLLADRSTRWRSPGTPIVAHTTTNLASDDLVRVDGVPCTSVARTLLLLAGEPGAEESAVRVLVDAAIDAEKASDAWLWWRLEQLRCRGRSGVTMLASILTARAGSQPTESWLERRFLELVDDAGIQAPVCQRRVEHRGAFAARVDFLFERERLVVEVLGHAFHASPSQLTADAERRAKLLLAGYRVLEFTYDQIVGNPVEVVAMLVQALSAPRAA